MNNVPRKCLGSNHPDTPSGSGTYIICTYKDTKFILYIYRYTLKRLSLRNVTSKPATPSKPNRSIVSLRFRFKSDSQKSIIHPPRSAAAKRERQTQPESMTNLQEINFRTNGVQDVWLILIYATIVAMNAGNIYICGDNDMMPKPTLYVESRGSKFKFDHVIRITRQNCDDSMLGRRKPARWNVGEAGLTRS